MLASTTPQLSAIEHGFIQHAYALLPNDTNTSFCSSEIRSPLQSLSHGRGATPSSTSHGRATTRAMCLHAHRYCVRLSQCILRFGGRGGNLSVLKCRRERDGSRAHAHTPWHRTRHTGRRIRGAAGGAGRHALTGEKRREEGSLRSLLIGWPCRHRCIHPIHPLSLTHSLPASRVTLR